MNLNASNPVVITEEDYELLKPFFSKTDGSKNEMSLSAELSRAVIVKNDAFPPHGIRVNSRIHIKDLDNGKVMEFTIVMPQYADMKSQKVSILSPMAAALIGFRKGETVKWKVPAGLKTFEIVDVQN